MYVSLDLHSYFHLEETVSFSFLGDEPPSSESIRPNKTNLAIAVSAARYIVKHGSILKLLHMTDGNFDAFSSLKGKRCISMPTTTLNNHCNMSKIALVLSVACQYLRIYCGCGGNRRAELLDEIKNSHCTGHLHE